MKYLLLFLLVISIRIFAQDNGVPHYMTPQEKLILKDYIKNLKPNETDITTPPPTPLRTMAEWEECQGIVIKWMSFTSILTEIVRYASQEGLVFVLCSDSNTVKNALISASIPTVNIRYIKAVNSGSQNSIWARDYGPWAAYSNNMDSLSLIDWIYNRPRPGDDTNSVTIGQFLNVPVYRTLVAPNDLVNTGGNFMVDGHGTAFASKLILSDNGPGNPFGASVKTEAQINSIVNAYMGIDRYIKMETLPYDQIHHIDMHIKLLDEETLLVGQYPAGIADGPQIEANLQYILSNFLNCYGKPYKVVRILMPPENGLYPNNGGDYRTYTNSLIINKTVIVPLYEQQYDTTALRIYHESMPGYRIMGINCNSIIPSLGAIHCITKEIGVYEPIFISHSRLGDTSNTTQPYPVKAYIKTKSGVASAKVFWSIDTSAGFNQVPMTSSSADTFTANIPPQIFGTKIYYYISAQSNSGRTVAKPFTAPGGNYQFRITVPIGITQINNNVPGKFNLYQNYPNPFNPSTKIRFNIPFVGNAYMRSVQLKVFDLLGKEVSVPVNQQMKPGNYEVEWNAVNYPSGIYFYKLQTETFTDVKKMVLIK